MTASVTNLRPVVVERRKLPPVPVPEPSCGAPARIDHFDTYAVIRCGEIYAKVERFTYWDESYGNEPVEVSFESRIYGLQETCGTCDVCADRGQLLDLARIASCAATLIEEAAGSS